MGLGVLGHLSGVQNRDVIGRLQQLNTERLAGKLSVRQYQLRQQEVLNDYLKKLGWMGCRVGRLRCGWLLCAGSW